MAQRVLVGSAVAVGGKAVSEGSEVGVGVSCCVPEQAANVNTMPITNWGMIFFMAAPLS